eukprot:1404268-Pleurochrysis_carterae.AAC.1
MAALRMEWQPLEPARRGGAAEDAGATTSRSGTLAAAWLTGAGGEPLLARRRLTQLHMLGLGEASSASG